MLLLLVFIAMYSEIKSASSVHWLHRVITVCIVTSKVMLIVLQIFPEILHEVQSELSKKRRKPS